MSLAISAPFSFLRNEASKQRWRWHSRLQRYGRAWRYARQRLTQDDAEIMLGDAERASGIFGLESMSRDSILEAARARWGDVSELSDFADDAFDRIMQKWNSEGHLTDAAESWAIDLIEEFAAEAGVDLVEIADE